MLPSASTRPCERQMTWSASRNARSGRCVEKISARGLSCGAVQRAEGTYVDAVYAYHKAVAALEEAVGPPLRQS